MRLESPTCAHFCGLVARLDWVGKKRCLPSTSIECESMSGRVVCMVVGWHSGTRAMRPRFINNLLKHIFGYSKTFIFTVSSWSRDRFILRFVATRPATWHPFREFISDINARFISSWTLNSYLTIKINNDNDHNLSEFKENDFFPNSFIVMGIIFMGWLGLSVCLSFLISFFN